jgi:flagellar hook assembly protein FlgD
VHDIQGRHVATLLDGFMEAGEHTVEWNGMSDSGHSAGSGIYFIHYQAAGVSQSYKVVLTK